MEKQGLTPNSFYILTCTTACTVTAVDAWGTTHTLIAPETAGQHVFLSIADKISISDESAIISGPFAKAPASLGSAGGGSAPAPTPTPEALMTHAKATWDISPELPYIALYVQVANAAGDILLNNAFGGADTPEELAAELNALEGMSSLLAFSSEGNTLIATAVAAGEAGNGMRFGFMSTQPPHPECLMTLSGGGIVSGPLKHQHVYLATATAGLDLSALTVETYGTAEIWIDYTAGSVTLGAWTWPDDDEPSAWTAGNRYCLVLRNDGAATLAAINYSYAQS